MSGDDWHGLSPHSEEITGNTMSTTPQDATLAERIVDSLLTTWGSGKMDQLETGTRLQVMQKQENGTERALGGWCRASAVRQVQEAIDE